MNTAVRSRAHPTQPGSYLECIAQDTRSVPEILRPHGTTDVGPLEIPAAWYLDRAYHDLEVERIWKKCWQMACREEELAEVGDTCIYEIVGISLVLVRSSKREIKAFYNSCLHRGVMLRKCAGRVTQLQCPFHGFTWGLDGSLRMIPCAEEFAHIKREDFQLPEVKVGRWGGFVFVNLDPDSESLESFLGNFPRHFERYPYDNRVKTAHVAKIFPCNWKMAHEAFMEAWHVLTVHPQYASIFGERCNQQEAWGNYSRGVVTACTTSDYIRETPSPQKVYEAAMGRWDDSDPLPPLPEGVSARAGLADATRESLRPAWGSKVDELSDTELIDVFYFSLFPNFDPFGALASLVYRFRPNGDDHTSCVMDLMLVTPVAPGAEPAAPAPVRWLGEDEDFSAVSELGLLGPFVSQDIENLGNIMRGLRNNRRGRVVFAKDQELKIRHFYALWQKATGLDPSA